MKINGPKADAATDPLPRAIAGDGPTLPKAVGNAASKPPKNNDAAPAHRGLPDCQIAADRQRASPVNPSLPHKPLERMVLAAVIKALALHPRVSWAHRMNVGAFRDGNRYVRVGFVGCSDIIGQTTDGRFLAVEVKRPGGKPTEAQVEFLGRVQRAGGVAFVAWSVDDVNRGLM